jgi:hypothetical protein
MDKMTLRRHASLATALIAVFASVGYAPTQSANPGRNTPDFHVQVWGEGESNRHEFDSETNPCSGSVVPALTSPDCTVSGLQNRCSGASPSPSSPFPLNSDIQLLRLLSPLHDESETG